MHGLHVTEAVEALEDMLSERKGTEIKNQTLIFAPAAKRNRLKIVKNRDRKESLDNKTPKVVSVGCVGLWKNNGVLSEFGKIRETGKMCHVMSIDE